MLYWGYRSPWWLLDADTVFEPGVFIEGRPSRRHAHALRPRQRYARAGPGAFLLRGRAGAGQGFAGHLAFGLVVEQLHRQGALAGRLRDGHGPRQPAAAALGDWDWLSPPECEQMGTFFKLVKAAPRASTTVDADSGKSVEERALRLLLHGRQDGRSCA